MCGMELLASMVYMTITIILAVMAVQTISAFTNAINVVKNLLFD